MNPGAIQGFNIPYSTYSASWGRWRRSNLWISIPVLQDYNVSRVRFVFPQDKI